MKSYEIFLCNCQDFQLVNHSHICHIRDIETLPLILFIFTLMDTSIINIIRNSAIVQHKNGTQPHLINVYTWHLLASYVDWRWEATTWEIKLNISCLDLDNLTDMDKDAEWTVIAW